MSELIVPLTTVDEVVPHPNAERLDIARIKGWQVVVAKDSMKHGDLVVYVPPDAMVPDEWAQRWGVAPYLGKDGRVLAVRLRGEPSYGFAVPVKNASVFGAGAWGGIATDGSTSLETNVADLFGITKYVPALPVRSRGAGGGYTDDRAPEHPAFARYTDIENMRHWPTMLDGLEVVVTEKIHGTNSRIAVIDGVRMAGSHRVQRRSPEDEADRIYSFEVKQRRRELVDWLGALPAWQKVTHKYLSWPVWHPMPETINDRNPGSSVYWKPWSIDGVAAMLDALGKVYNHVELFGELYGPSIQKLGYGVPAGEVEYVAFDLMLDRQYVNFAEFSVLCTAFDVPTAPVLTVETFDIERIKAMSEGPTILGNGVHFREGVVVKPAIEQRGPHGRLIAKFVGDEYLTDKHGASEDLSNDRAEAEGESIVNAA